MVGHFYISRVIVFSRNFAYIFNCMDAVIYKIGAHMLKIQSLGTRICSSFLQ